MRDATRTPYVLVGSCGEDKVHIHNASTGAFVRDVTLPPPHHLNSLDGFYCQSLRGDPFHPLNFSVLVNCQRYFIPPRLVHFDLMRSADEEMYHVDPHDREPSEEDEEAEEKDVSL
jgi:hypothetical protein